MGIYCAGVCVEDGGIVLKDYNVDLNMMGPGAMEKRLRRG